MPSMHEAGENITGTSHNPPEAIRKTLKFMSEAMHVRRIGIVYNPGEQNSVAQIKAIQTEIERHGYPIRVVEAAVANTSEVKQAAESLIGRIDAFYVITDNTVVSGLEGLVSVADARKIAVFTGDIASLKRGGFAAYGVKFYDIGYRAGQMAAAILKGEKRPKDIPPEFAPNPRLVINEKVAARLGIAVRPEWEAEVIGE
ncbi:MAG: ABC transporter substrate-binding protein [Hydrogenibacillus schlegelii]|uniref:ABC transporter substrate-binding protein n=1 Tax=Hydrogenibacillus schlegelii TaxID=1484 RepID=A0A2T5G816_HYDSH|nr:MAG: ABC transporter substrate-binding protein [Hydrogenibacillus schlegelii]